MIEENTADDLGTFFSAGFLKLLEYLHGRFVGHSVGLHNLPAYLFLNHAMS